MYQSSIKSARRVHSAQKLPPLSSKRVHFSSQVAKSRKTAHCSSYQTTISQLYIHVMAIEDGDVKGNMDDAKNLRRQTFHTFQNTPFFN